MPKNKLKQVPSVEKVLIPVVVGDTVGDPFKDTSAPSLNILIKLMDVISWLLHHLFHRY